MSIESLSDAIRKEFTTLGMPCVLEMAILSTTRKVIYSDLSKAAMNKILPFYNNMLPMVAGDSISLALDATKTIVVSRVSGSAILIAITDKKVGIVLTKTKGVADKFGKLLDELLLKEESKPHELVPTPQVAAEATPGRSTFELALQARQTLFQQTTVQLSKTVTPFYAAEAPSVVATVVPPLVNQAKRIIDEARVHDVTLRAIGGMAVALHCPSARLPALMREYPDIDLVGHKKEAKGMKEVFLNLGFDPNRRFNALHGDKRLKFLDEKNEVDVDVMLDVFEMCHKLELRDRLSLDKYTISLADLLITKLQIVNLNEKDVRDVIAILLDHEAGNAGPEEIDMDYIARLCSNDWGLWKTLSMNSDKILDLLGDYDLQEDQEQRVKLRFAGFLKRLEAEPKSSKWKIRSKVGERNRWYEPVEEVRRQ